MHWQPSKNPIDKQTLLTWVLVFFFAIFFNYIICKASILAFGV